MYSAVAKDSENSSHDTFCSVDPLLYAIYYMLISDYYFN